MSPGQTAEKVKVVGIVARSLRFVQPQNSVDVMQLCGHRRSRRAAQSVPLGASHDKFSFPVDHSFHAEIQAGINFLIRFQVSLRPPGSTLGDFIPGIAKRSRGP